MNEAVIKRRPTLSRESWTAMARHHREQIEPWVKAFQNRKMTGQKHPVHDFLFEYYRCKRRLIKDWHPPVELRLEGQGAQSFLKSPRYSEDDQGVYLDPTEMKPDETSRMAWIIQLIDNALSKRSQHNCYGLHEWAMLYKEERIRHQDTPLRLDPKEIERLIESHTVRCTHYDAFRFFTKEAQPLNTLQPSQEERINNEQFGCIHFNMDLFKWCYKLHPWISSELLVKCFILATEARELDMRASPYDLQHYELTPIFIETAEGRAQYQVLQMQIANKGRALARLFLDECCKVMAGSNH